MCFKIIFVLLQLFTFVRCNAMRRYSSVENQNIEKLSANHTCVRKKLAGLVCCLFLLGIGTLSAQPRAVITIVGANELFVGIDNKVMVKYNRTTSKYVSLVAERTDATLQLLSNDSETEQTYLLRIKDTGDITVHAETTISNIENYIGRVVFHTSLLPTPQLALDKFRDGNVLRKADLKKVSHLRVFFDNPLLDQTPLTLRSFTFQHQDSPTEISSTGDTLTTEMLQLIEQGEPGHTVTITQAEVQTPDGRVHHLTATFRIY